MLRMLTELFDLTVLRGDEILLVPVKYTGNIDDIFRFIDLQALA